MTQPTVFETNRNSTTINQLKQPNPFRVARLECCRGLVSAGCVGMDSRNAGFVTAVTIYIGSMVHSIMIFPSSVSDGYSSVISASTKYDVKKRCTM